jgi:hypothetical protein
MSYNRWTKEEDELLMGCLSQFVTLSDCHKKFIDRGYNRSKEAVYVRARTWRIDGVVGSNVAFVHCGEAGNKTSTRNPNVFKSHHCEDGVIYSEVGYSQRIQALLAEKLCREFFANGHRYYKTYRDGKWRKASQEQLYNLWQDKCRVEKTCTTKI